MTEIVAPTSLVTLNYRITLPDDTEVISTFGSTPATLQMGSGELAPSLERCLAGLPVGEHHVFLLEPQQGFGPHNPNLVERFARTELPNSDELSVMAMVEFKTPEGAGYAGVVRELDDENVVIDFNHPLAGKTIRFEVEVIGII